MFCIDFIILGTLVIIHPIKTIPIKFNNLPKNPFAVFLIVFPVAFNAPLIPLASIKPSLLFLKNDSLLLTKNDCSSEIILFFFTLLA